MYQIEILPRNFWNKSVFDWPMLRLCLTWSEAAPRGQQSAAAARSTSAARVCILWVREREETKSRRGRMATISCPAVAAPGPFNAPPPRDVTPPTPGAHTPVAMVAFKSHPAARIHKKEKICFHIFALCSNRRSLVNCPLIGLSPPVLCINTFCHNETRFNTWKKEEKRVIYTNNNFLELDVIFFILNVYFLGSIYTCIWRAMCKRCYSVNWRIFKGNYCLKYYCRL